MGKWIILLFWSWWVTSCKEEGYFEGTIGYKVYISPDSASANGVRIKDYYGDEATFKTKNGDYVWEMEGDTAISMLYRADENRHYFTYGTSQVVIWRSGSQVTDSITSIKVLDSVAEHMGYKINILEVQSILTMNGVKRIRQIYFAPELRSSPDFSAKNKDGNYDEIYALTNAFPLKIVDDYGTFAIIYEANKVKPGTVPSTDFKIKEGSILKELK